MKAIQKREEDDASFVVLRWRREDVSRKRDGGREQFVVAGKVTCIERGQRQRGGRSDGIENSQQRVAVTLLVAEDEAIIVEVVARIHPHARREFSPHGDFQFCVEQGNLDAIDFFFVGADDC